MWVVTVRCLSDYLATDRLPAENRRYKDKPIHICKSVDMSITGNFSLKRHMATNRETIEAHISVTNHLNIWPN